MENVVIALVLHLCPLDGWAWMPNCEAQTFDISVILQMVFGIILKENKCHANMLWVLNFRNDSYFIDLYFIGFSSVNAAAECPCGEGMEGL